VLLLDEPTNHLDLAGIQWLEDWLGRFPGAFIAISHDRTFLRRLTRSSLWLDRGGLRRAEVGYGGFEAWTEQVYAEEARAADKLDAKLKLELHWLERGVTARRRRNQGRLTKLGEMRAARAAMLGPAGTAKLGLETDDVRTKMVIEAAGVTKRYPLTPFASSPSTARWAGAQDELPPMAEVEKSVQSGEGGRFSTSLEMNGNGKGEGAGSRTIVRDFSLRIQRGDRIGVVGANGTGKTTLLKLLTGEIAPDEGKVTRAKTLAGVMIDQQRKLLDPAKSVRDVLADGGDWIEVRGSKKHVQGYLKDFLFEPNLIDAKIGTLSGGERSRLLLAREFARASNLLVLDEPTNDLDMETLDLLQEVIADYEGTVLIVSHDRDFLDRTVTITLELDGSGKVDIVAGGYEDWARKRGEGDAVPRRRPGSRSEAQTGPGPRPSPGNAAKKLTYKDQRDLDLLPARIEALDAAIARDEAALSDHDLYMRDPRLFEALTSAVEAARAEREAAEERWLLLAEAAEAIK